MDDYISSYFPADETATYIPQYYVEAPTEEQGEIRQLEPNEEPLSWQIENLGTNYETLKKGPKKVFDTLLPQSDVTAAHNYYEEMPTKGGNAAVATAGSLLTGPIYNYVRETATDPLSLLASMPSVATGAKLGFIGKMKKSRKYNADDFLYTPRDEKYMASVGQPADSKWIAAYNDLMNSQDFSPEIATLGRYDDKTGKLKSYKPINPDDFRSAMIGHIAFPQYYNAHSISPYVTYGEDVVPGEMGAIDKDIYRGVPTQKAPTGIEYGKYGTENPGLNGSTYYGVGQYAGDKETAQNYGNFVYKLQRQYPTTWKNILQTYRNWATVPSKAMKQKLIALFGPEVATKYRYTPLHNYVIGATYKNPINFAKELQDLQIYELQHYEPTVGQNSSILAPVQGTLIDSYLK